MDWELQLLGGITKRIRVLKATPQQHYTNPQSGSFFFIYICGAILLYAAATKYYLTSMTVVES